MINRASFKIILRTNAANKGFGTCPLVCQAIINGKTKTKSLNVSVLPEQWDKTNQKVINHPRAADINLIIQSDIAKATEILTEYRLLRKYITIDEFMEQFASVSNRYDFIEFMESSIQKRFDRGEIVLGTYKAQKSTLNKLKKYKQAISLYELSEDLIRDFDIWHKIYLSKSCKQRGREQKQNSHNTRAKALTHLKTYINLAIKKRNLKIQNPFEDITITERYGQFVFLETHELQTIHEQFKLIGDDDKTFKISIAMFILGCYTSLRISDLCRIGEIKVTNRELTFQPIKSKRFNKTVSIPLNNTAFHYYHYLVSVAPINTSDVTVNKYLKRISRVCRIPKHLTTHVARHTFATQFINSGGNVVVLQEILGHSDIRTTMKYVHLVSNTKRDQINNMMQLVEL